MISTTDLRNSAATETLLERLAVASPAELEAARAELEALTLRPGRTSGQAGRRRAVLTFIAEVQS